MLRQIPRGRGVKYSQSLDTAIPGLSHPARDHPKNHHIQGPS